MNKKGEISEREFVTSMKDPAVERPRGKGVHLNMSFAYNKYLNCTMVHWTCPVCQRKNFQRWYGRSNHICIECEQPTELK